MIQYLLRTLVKKCFPEYYEELLQDEHEQFLVDIGLEKDSLAFNILKDRESYDRYIESCGEYAAGNTNEYPTIEDLANTSEEV